MTKQKINELIELIKALEWDYDDLSIDGRKTYDKIIKLIEDYDND